MAKRLSSDYINRSILWGTMKPEDIMYHFARFLAKAKKEERIILGRNNSSLLNEAVAIIKKYPKCFGYSATADLPARMENEVNDIAGALFDVMDNIAPEGCYFGARPGDGTDYGFWESDDNW